MAQSLPRNRSFTRRLLLAAFCLAGLAWCIVPGKAPPTALRMTLHGNKLLVPLAYIPKYARGWYRQDGIVNDGLGLTAEWKGGKLRPFIDPQDNTPIWISHQDKISILVKRFGNNTLEQKYHLAQYFSSIWMSNRKQVASSYGLLRYEHDDLPQREQEDAVIVHYEQDLYLYPSLEQIGRASCRERVF